MTAAIVLLIVSVIPVAHAQTIPLPFDTVGANRGDPPNRHALSPNMKWVNGDTLLMARAGAYPEAAHAPRIIRLEAWGRDTLRLSSGGPSARELTFAACPFALSLYRTPNRTGIPRWESNRARSAVACPILGKRAGGSWDASRDLRTGFFADFVVSDIVGDSLPAARYYFRYSVRLRDGRRFEYADGDAYVAGKPPREGHDFSKLRYTSGSAIVGEFPRELDAWTVITNTTSQAVSFVRACAPRARLWKNAERTGAAAWKSEGRWVPRPPLLYPHPASTCSPEDVLLMPNDSLAYHVRVPVAEIVKDSEIADGRYGVGTELVLARESAPGVVDTTAHLRFDAGEVVITRSDEIAPSSRQLGAIHIAAATRLVPGRSADGDSVHVFVLMTNTSDRAAEVELLRGNPLWGQVYRSAAERDQIRTSRSSYMIPIGVPREFIHTFTLGTGQRWLFERAVAAKEIVAAIGPGRAYFLTYIVGMPDYRTTLSAGDLELR